MNYDVFLSYARKDRKLAEDVFDYLVKNGLKCFIDVHNIVNGYDWASEIVSGIENSKIMLIIFSEETNNSLQTRRELHTSAQANLPTLVYKISNVEFNKTFSFFLSGINWIDASSDNYGKFNDLLKSIEGLLCRKLDSSVSDVPQAVKFEFIPDADCVLTLNGENTEIKLGEKVSVSLQIGRYSLKFTSKQYEHIFVEEICDISPDKLNLNIEPINISLRDEIIKATSDSRFIPFFEHQKIGFKLNDEKIIDAIYDSVSPFVDGLSLVRISEFFGFIDKLGDVVVPIIYKKQSVFVDERACLQRDGYYGYVDKLGNEVIPFVYEKAQPFNEGFSSVKFDGKWGLIDVSGNVMIPFKYKNPLIVSNGLACVNINDKWGYIDVMDKVIIPPEYDVDAVFLKGGVVVQRKGDSWGIIDVKGVEVVAFIYDAIIVNNDEMIRLRKDDKYGYINKLNRNKLPVQYEIATEFTSGMASVRLDGKYGCISRSGKSLSSFKYQSPVIFNEGLANVCMHGKWGFIDRKENKVIQFKYGHARGFVEGLACVRNMNKQYGYIDKNDNCIIPMHYDDARSFAHGLATVKLNGKWGLINKDGNKITPMKYS